MLGKLFSLYEKMRKLGYNPPILGLLSLLWFILRTGTKPSRAVYPCQRAAVANSYIWLTIYAIPFLRSLIRKISEKIHLRRGILLVVISITIVGGALVLWSGYETVKRGEMQEIGLKISGKLAEYGPASSIFVVNGTRGNDDGIFKLIDLMGEHGLFFYKSPEHGRNKSPDGLISRDDVVIIKVNGQWDERGGTNTDLVKAPIQAILDRPYGFVGEIVVADNGQAQYGSAGFGGSFSWNRNNAENISQSIQSVVDFFAGRNYKVPTYLWDTITTKQVSEYSEGDIEDGYVVNATKNPRTGIMVSYPKFRTKFGTYISFKYGV